MIFKEVPINNIAIDEQTYCQTPYRLITNDWLLHNTIHQRTHLPWPAHTYPTLTSHMYTPGGGFYLYRQGISSNLRRRCPQAHNTLWPFTVLAITTVVTLFSINLQYSCACEQAAVSLIYRLCAAILNNTIPKSVVIMPVPLNTNTNHNIQPFIIKSESFGADVTKLAKTQNMWKAPSTNISRKQHKIIVSYVLNMRRCKKLPLNRG